MKGGDIGTVGRLKARSAGADTFSAAKKDNVGSAPAALATAWMPEVEQRMGQLSEPTYLDALQP